MDIGSPMSGIVHSCLSSFVTLRIIPLATKKGMMNARQQDEDDGEPVFARPVESLVKETASAVLRFGRRGVWK